MPPNVRDTWSDTWVGVDDLGRRLPGFEEVGPPRADRSVGIFYFLWLGEHEANGPRDVTRILAEDPAAMQKPESPLWGPMHAAHHWGEPLFGYYRTDDRYVLRRHAQMLTDAGVDFVVFDVTNQITYRDYYMALLDEWSKVRAEGGATPRVAFLCPFWQPRKVVEELWRDLYQPGVHPELWFRWQGKPLILADPELLAAKHDLERTDVPAQLAPGHTLGQSITLEAPFLNISMPCPTWETTGGGLTLTLRRDGPEGELVATQTYTNVRDNQWLRLDLERPQPAGAYYLEASDPIGTVGWWGTAEDALPGGQAYADRQPVPGDRSIGHLGLGDAWADILSFFCFRAPQPSYFEGPRKPDMWSWLEVSPQHVFRNSAGEAEQMAVGVAQNAVGDRLGSMSEPGARGRSYTEGGGDRSAEPGAVRRGYNFAEQLERAMEVDPRVIFITGWNEWIAGRFNEFGGVRMPVMFVDQFDQEHSRDMEPMRGGHGDDYYFQLTAAVRRYKGVRQPPAASGPKTIDLAGDWTQWDDVAPEYLDDQGDPARRDHPGYNRYAQLTNSTGRNDLLRMKVARDDTNLYFLAECAEALTPCDQPHWMCLYLNLDGRRETGWQGFEFALNREVRSAGRTTLQAWTGDGWRHIAEVPLRIDGARLMLAVPREALGIPAGPVALEFKWADNISGDDPMEFYLNGDTAPSGRFNYPYRAPASVP